MKKLHLQLFLLFSLTSICNTAIGSDTIAQQRLYFNPSQQSSTPAHVEMAERAHSALHNPCNKHKQQPNYPTQNQLNTVLSWMSQLYTSAPAYAATQPIASPKPIARAPKKTVLRYTLSSTVNDYCNAHDIDTKNLQSCNGDEQQHAIHGEFIAITEQSAVVWKNSQYTPALKEIPSILADFTDAGIQFNHQGDTDKAITLADTCWMLLDCVQAIGEGVFQGVYATVDDIIHPIRTVQNIVESTALCGYYISKIALEICELEYLFHTNQPAEAFKKQNAWANNVITVYETLQEKCATLTTHDAIKETVAFGTQCYATNKALRGIGTLFKQAHKHAIKIIEEVSHTATAPALTTPEGIVFRIADSTAESMKSNKTISASASIQNKHASSLPEFIRDNRVPIDRETILSCPSFEKTKITPVKGAQIYKKNQQFYHRDTLHKGKGAHLEVYNKSGKHLGEADPVSGQLIKKTQDKTKKLTL